MIPFYDLKTINLQFKAEFNVALNEQFENADWILGEAVQTFEQAWASYTQTKYCIGTSNGLDALFLIFEGYKTMGKLKQGDKVLVTNHTYIASVLAIIRAGLVPVLVDFSEGYQPTTQDFIRHYTKEVKAVLVVHLYGEIHRDMPSIKSLCADLDVLLIEDAAQSHGASLNHQTSGSFGQTAAFSFYPTKNLGALGDAGAVVTNDEELANTLKMLSNYGSAKKYHHQLVGYNHRLDTLQAQVLMIKLKQLNEFNQKRRQVATWYQQELNNPIITLPQITKEAWHVYHLFVVKTKYRDLVQQALATHHIQSMIHYPFAIGKHQAFKGLWSHKSLVSDQLSEQVLSLPMSPILSHSEVQKIAEVIIDIKP